MILHYIQLFFIYSLLGFIWETLWVSITEKKLAKRGFLKGPILPIYGFGALIILISVHPYTDNPFMIYFAGMTAATILELITGYLMEKLLHVRYWDYDERPLNFHGYICARSSLFWGLISIILVKQINPGVEDYLNNFSFPFLNHMTIVLIMVFILDLSLSLKEAIDLRNLIHYGEKLSEYSEQLLEEIHEKSVDKKEELLQIFEQSSAAQAIEDLENGVQGIAPKKFPKPIFGNVLPHIDVFLENGYTKEEMKMINETRKILHIDDLKITATTVRVPVLNAHSESINVETIKPFELKDVICALENTDGVKVYDDIDNLVYPTPLEASDKDDIFVGRIRRDFSIDNGLNLWVVADNIRKGAALNAVQIAELMINNK